MEIVYSVEARADLEWWKRHGDTATKNKIQKLITEISEHPFTGIGKP